MVFFTKSFFEKKSVICDKIAGLDLVHLEQNGYYNMVCDNVVSVWKSSWVVSLTSG